MKISIQNLSIYLEKEKIMDQFHLQLEPSSFVTLLSDDDRVAQALFFAIAGLIPYDGDILLDHTPLTKKYLFLKKIGIIFHHQYLYLGDETLSKYLSLEKYDDVEPLIEKFCLKNDLDKKVETFSTSKKQFFVLLSAYLEEPKALFLEDPFSRMDEIDRNNAFWLLKKLNREKDTIVVHFTNDVEDILRGKDLILLQKGRVLEQGKVEDMLDYEKSFLKIGYDLPFLASLSYKLSYYNLIKNPVLHEKEMIDILWKSK